MPIRLASESTTTSAVLLTPAKVAVSTAVPSCLACTSPSGETTKTEESEDSYVTPWNEPLRFTSPASEKCPVTCTWAEDPYPPESSNGSGLIVTSTSGSNARPLVNSTAEVFTTRP
ncbi:hypothetical protein MVI01_34530 [Myxococcus virescens]|uniref:Uncharacterized protein n=1 Tax=Myxococcus virescens TaxID=83456 RepID=A0A511HGJ7_9BACT|nr:hypothetical protein MVI01_34530 [Myxococcus virescens]